MPPFDAAIIGGGPAGLSAALVLGRCCRRVLLVDEDRPRNGSAPGVHGFLTRDGIKPRELRRIGVRQLKRYDVTVLEKTQVTRVTHGDGGFALVAGGERFRARKLILATGMRDVLPRFQGCPELYGRGVYHCPYCDGWEVRGRRIAVYGTNGEGVEMAVRLRIWTPHVFFVSSGANGIRARHRRRLEKLGIPIIENAVERLLCSGRPAHFTGLAFRDRRPLRCAALFFVTSRDQRSKLCEALGCRFREDTVVTDDVHATRVPGLWVIGDAADEVQFAIVAAADGAKAAYAINEELHEEDLAAASKPRKFRKLREPGAGRRV